MSTLSDGDLEAWEYYSETYSKKEMGLNAYQKAAAKTAIYKAEHSILYPALGLAGEAIAIEAAIVHVADVYDNLRAPRPYREELPHSKAVDILVNGDEKSSPEHFNPDVLQALLTQHRDIESIYERYKPASPRQ